MEMTSRLWVWVWGIYETQMRFVFRFASCFYNVSYINILKPTKPETLLVPSLSAKGCWFFYICIHSVKATGLTGICWTGLGILKLSHTTHPHMPPRPLHGRRYSTGRVRFPKL